MEPWTLNPEIKKRMWLDVWERERWRGNENSEAEVPLLMRDTDWRAEMRPVTRTEEKHTHTHTHTHTHSTLTLILNTGQHMLVKLRFINACRNKKIDRKTYRKLVYIKEKLNIGCWINIRLLFTHIMAWVKPMHGRISIVMLSPK